MKSNAPDSVQDRIIGNSKAQIEFQNLAQSETKIRSCTLVGRSHIGKRSFLCSHISSIISDSDLLFPETSIDDMRDAIEFMASHPIFSPYKAMVIDNADSLTESAQNAILKLMEEPSGMNRVYLILEDFGNLIPPLQSRIDNIIYWNPLNLEEMNEFAKLKMISDSEIINLLHGIPGFYDIISSNRSFIDFYKMCLDIFHGRVNPMLLPTPKVISDLKSGRSDERDLISHILTQAIHSSLSTPINRLTHFTKFNSHLMKVLSLNAEIHWQSTCLKYFHET